jgi:hypothetical protein
MWNRDDVGLSYMDFCFRVGNFELPKLIICEDVILIYPHVIQVRIAFPFDQILKTPSPAEAS